MKRRKRSTKRREKTQKNDFKDTDLLAATLAVYQIVIVVADLLIVVNSDVVFSVQVCG